MKASEMKQLMKVISFVVREELKKELPRVVESVLTEKYLRKIMAEARQPSLTEVVGDDLRSEEDLQNEPPEIMSNTHKGIYQKNPLMKGKESTPQRESFTVAAKMLAGDNPALSDIYENIDPRALQEMREGATGPKEIPLEAMDRKFNFDRMNELLGNDAKPSAPSRSNNEQALQERAEKMLEMRRQRLEVPVNGGGQPRRVLAESTMAAPSHLDIPPFEMIPGA